MKSFLARINPFAAAVLLSVSAFFLSSCSHVMTSQTAGETLSATRPPSHMAPETVGSIQNPNVTESSGMTASRCSEDVLWTHNDSGDANLIFALDTTGKDLATYIVDGSTNKDWEDIASFRDSDGRCFLLIGDIGNNGMRRTEMTVYRIPEPPLETGQKTDSVPGVTAKAEAIRYNYGERVFDAETLMVNPLNGDIYVVTKQVSGGAKVFRVGNARRPGSGETAVEVGEISAPSLPAGLFTGGDISPDGTRAVVTDYFYGYEMRLDDPSEPFDEIWKKPMNRIDLGPRKQGESVCYSQDGKRLFAGSERAGSPLNMVVLRD